MRTMVELFSIILAMVCKPVSLILLSGRRAGRQLSDVCVCRSGVKGCFMFGWMAWVMWPKHILDIYNVLTVVLFSSACMIIDASSSP